jgi:HD superfamily phosphohydrolase YqeK
VSDSRYLVVNSGRVAEQIEEALRQAEAAGLYRDALRSLRWAKEEMERTPHEFGESRDYREFAKLHERVAFVGLLRVHFGIHDSSRTVFVGRVVWIG